MTRQIDWRIEVLRRGVPVCTLQPTQAPQITASLDADIKMSMSAIVRHDERVDYMRDTLRPVMLIDGETHELGEFFVGAAPASWSDAGVRFDSIEAYDGCYILSTTRTEEILHFDKGSGYKTAIDGLLIAAGITRRILSPTSAVFLTEREDWDVGTDYLSILNRLLHEINFAPVRFDARGYALLQPLDEPRTSAVRWHYGGPGQTLVARPASAAMDLFGQPNVFIVTCANPELAAPMTATAVNDNPLSMLSTLRVGRRIAQRYSVDNIASQEDLEIYARTLRDTSILRGQTVQITTQAEPGHAIGEIVAVQHDAVGGIYRETAWNLSPDGQMEHTLQRLILA